MKVYVLTGTPPYERRFYVLGVYGSIDALEKAEEDYKNYKYYNFDWDEFEVE